MNYSCFMRVYAAPKFYHEGQNLGFDILKSIVHIMSGIFNIPLINDTRIKLCSEEYVNCECNIFRDRSDGMILHEEREVILPCLRLKK